VLTKAEFFGFLWLKTGSTLRNFAKFALRLAAKEQVFVCFTADRG